MLIFFSLFSTFLFGKWSFPVLAKLHTHIQEHTRAVLLIEYLLFLCLGLWFCQFYAHILTQIYIKAAVIVSVYVLCCAFIFSHFLIKIFNDFARAHGLNKRTQTHVRRGQKCVCFFSTYIQHAPIMYTYVCMSRKRRLVVFVVLFSKQFIYLLLFISCATRDRRACFSDGKTTTNVILLLLCQRHQLLLYTVIHIHKIPMLILSWAVHTEHC